MIKIKRFLCMLICTISLFSIGCNQAVSLDESPYKIIVKDNQGKQIEITSKKEIENFDDMLLYENWEELDDTVPNFNSNISIIEEYKSSKDKSREICFNKDSKHIKLIVDGKHTTFYKVDVKVYDEIYNNISTILYNDFKGH